MHELGLYLYIALVTGPFGNLSSDFNLLVDFIARERAMQTMKLRGTNPALALAVHRRALVRRIGLLTSRGWAQHIVDRWRDAVSNRPQHPIPLKSILQLMSFFLTTRTVAATTACTCLVLKASALLVFLIMLVLYSSTNRGGGVSS